jgi:hypothetical protein
MKTPIHDRKKKSSLTKSEMKRKSAAKVNTFIKEVVNDVNQKTAKEASESVVKKQAVASTYTNLNNTFQKSAVVKLDTNVMSSVSKTRVAPASSHVKPVLPPPASEVKKAIDKRQLNNSNLLNQTKVVDKTINRPISTVKQPKIVEQK